jgi:hypothetical protein
MSASVAASKDDEIVGVDAVADRVVSFVVSRRLRRTSSPDRGDERREAVKKKPEESDRRDMLECCGFERIRDRVALGCRPSRGQRQ